MLDLDIDLILLVWARVRRRESIIFFIQVIAIVLRNQERRRPEVEVKVVRATSIGRNLHPMKIMVGYWRDTISL